MKYNISENRKKYQFSHFTQRLPTLLTGLLIFGFLSKAAWTAYVEKKRSEEGALAAKMELAKLEERQAFVSEELSKLSTEEGREAKLREKFGVGKIGEQIAIIMKGENDDGNKDNSSNFWNQIKDFFKSLFQK